jgi:hypothetical protein
MEGTMTETTVEVKKTAPTAAVASGAPARIPAMREVARPSYALRSFRDEMERVFDRFTGALSVPSLRRMFDFEPVPRIESTFAFTMPAIDIAENENAYKITAEFPGDGGQGYRR